MAGLFLFYNMNGKKVKLVLLAVLFFLQSPAQCDIPKHPIIFIHGFLASGDTYAKQVQRFIERGYCEDRLFMFDWNSVSGNGKKTDSLLDAFITMVLKKTGARQVDLVGHSAGGGLGRGYLLDSLHASRVAHYIHLGSRKWFTEYSWFKNNKCLNIYSAGDKVAGSAGGVVEGATNLDLKDKDHYEVATSEETFNAIYHFINDDGKYPVIPTRLPNTPIFLGGKAVMLGDNTPLVNATVTVYQLDAKNGTRKKSLPVSTFKTDSSGNWGTFIASVDPETSYEMNLSPADTSQRRISYFFEPFLQSNKHIYLRGFPKGNMIASMLGSLPAKEDQSVIVVYSSNHAMIQGRDTVAVNDVPVTSPELTPASRTIISSFLFDDGDGISSGKAIRQFSLAPFLGGVDLSLPVNNKNGNRVYFNGRILVLPAIPSKDRILLAVFN